MAIVELVMPKMGESIMEATILRWHKKPGDAVKVDDTVLEIATDKVDSEVPSIADGVITEILYNENDVVPVGTVIARVETSADAAVAPSPAAAPAPAAEAPVQPSPNTRLRRPARRPLPCPHPAKPFLFSARAYHRTAGRRFVR